ncbi:hypothetical protein FA15DRAFT_660125 [Coprinopsis marcescibilis]|uniref:Uncharacterized protein n=1 Tax=Coprinopsis marcescibilis TaxID=230819 RepID=A0A5C3KG92_COPMA|nr:hypothetical protein FA15DRAFT_660125 [Coprinopsis marcescibilis]
MAWDWRCNGRGSYEVGTEQLCVHVSSVGIECCWGEADKGTVLDSLVWLLFLLRFGVFVIVITIIGSGDRGCSVDAVAADDMVLLRVLVFRLVPPIFPRSRALCLRLYLELANEGIGGKHFSSAWRDFMLFGLVGYGGCMTVGRIVRTLYMQPTQISCAG